MSYHAFSCRCGWTYGNTDGDQLHTGAAILTRDTTVRCPICGMERRWFAPRPARIPRKRKKGYLETTT